MIYGNWGVIFGITIFYGITRKGCSQTFNQVPHILTNLRKRHKVHRIYGSQRKYSPDFIHLGTRIHLKRDDFLVSTRTYPFLAQAHTIIRKTFPLNFNSTSISQKFKFFKGIWLLESYDRFRQLLDLKCHNLKPLFAQSFIPTFSLIFDSHTVQ